MATFHQPAIPRKADSAVLEVHTLNKRELACQWDIKHASRLPFRQYVAPFASYLCSHTRNSCLTHSYSKTLLMDSAATYIYTPEVELPVDQEKGDSSNGGQYCVIA
ncbi:hypothetical protein RhiJN_09839 [Ceratobasidium sp. AG-Ba]|nr:hypothetical protein RhiJN_09839 [Ceratobasidium sp. AG-Ba]